MWSPVLAPGLGLLHGPPALLRGFAQELSHQALRQDPERVVLWCDGDHGFNPYDFAELNLDRGLQADDGAERMLVKRCMTPFQWDTVLSHHLPQKLAETPASLALAIPFDRQFSTDELADWEAEDYVRHNVRHLRNVSRRHKLPILLGVDMARWWRTHPVLAKTTYEGADARWRIERVAGHWRLVPEKGDVLDAGRKARTTLLDFVREERPLTVAIPTAR